MRAQKLSSSLDMLWAPPIFFFSDDSFLSILKRQSQRILSWIRFTLCSKEGVDYFVLDRSSNLWPEDFPFISTRRTLALASSLWLVFFRALGSKFARFSHRSFSIWCVFLDTLLYAVKDFPSTLPSFPRSPINCQPLYLVFVYWAWGLFVNTHSGIFTRARTIAKPSHRSYSLCDKEFKLLDVTRYLFQKLLRST